MSSRHSLLAISMIALLTCLVSSARAQGIGPPRGTEILLGLFLVAAAFFVLVASTVLYLVVKKAVFGDEETSRWQKLGLFGASMLASAILGFALMMALDLR